MCGLLLAPGHYRDKLIEDAMASMGYRGADGFQDYIRSNGWTLAHVRLAIQSTWEEGQQPFRGAPGDSQIAFVGEIFAPGHRTEESHIRSAINSLRHSEFMNLDGFWAIAEISRGGFGRSYARVFTDHLSIKPLYHWVSKGIVCSEIEPMFKLDTKPAIDEIYMSNCMKWGYDITGRTPYEGIRQTPAGTVTTLGELDPTTYTDYTYWDWSNVQQWNRRASPSNDKILDLKGAVIRAIAARAGNSNRPVSMLLSGGLDSSIIYQVLQSRGYEVEAYSIENGETEFLPEGVTMLQPEAEPSYMEAVEIMQAPVDLGSLFPQIQLAKALGRAGSHVCITGDGADEVFGGYRRAEEYDSQYSDVFCELPYYHTPRLDRVMMRSTVELRSPYLAPEVVAAGLRLPREQRTSKQALKAAFADHLPPKILNRVKHPLKSKQVLSDPIQHRHKLQGAFREHYHQIGL